MQPYGEVVQLTPLVRRIVAPNPGPMTGPGTNTYLVGSRDVAVIDPGPAIPEHIAAIEAAVGDHLRWIVCTHTHPDHSPGAAVLAKHTGAALVGSLTEDDQHQDLTFHPDWAIDHDSTIEAEDWSLTAIHTPGHVDNHFCYLLDQEGIVFAGDHIMNGSTVVIVPPGGDMKAYIQSLERLLDYDVRRIAPGHGELIEDCRAEVAKLVRHRLMREAKVFAALDGLSPCSVDDLVPVVYDDTDPSLYQWAALSLRAHLIKLEKDGRALDKAGVWHALV
ncbi:MBL fold metallo-hydrolase [Luminiphilus syltensis]|uniref:MBL fold metallo-hydrolase n=1 Tax=Luminiphilus syltensis TaxID=1341119 RepID=UPI000301D9D0|nr:MBL fold metallo-hydrolase [Luminiphilus syltensis]